MKMKMILIGMVMVIAMAINVQAQTTPPVVTAPTQMFVFSGNIAGFNGASGTNGAVIATAALQLTPAISTGYEHLAISALNVRGEMGVIAYTKPLSSFFGSKVASKLLVDTSAIGLTISGGAGKILQPTANRVGETLGVHLSYPLSANMSWQVGIDVLHGAGRTTIITSNYNDVASTGLVVHF